ncbi:MAG: ribosome-associated translation inhibitor RaiA [Anaerolineae bacterium]|nr:ribosome-associated translation inhibitor RaiA [Anaerolineae bacterium]
MELTIKGKNVEITDRLRDYVEKKIGKLDRYLPTISEAWVELTSEETKAAADRQVCQITVRSNGTILRAEERSDDMFSSIDNVLDKMYRQIARYKGKRQNRWRGASVTPEPLPIELEEEEPEGLGDIVRVKRFAMVPMHPEEAVEQMELLGHDFFVFFNADEGRINVLYRRKGGNYGLLQPELV